MKKGSPPVVKKFVPPKNGKKQKVVIVSDHSSTELSNENDTIEKQKMAINLEDEEDLSLDISSVDIFSLARHGRFQQLKKILEMGVDPNSKDKNGNTLVIIGAQNGNKSIVKLALRFGGHINMTNCQGNTALHYCVEYSYIELAEYLLSKGANVDISNIKGFKCMEGIKPKTDPYAI